MSGFCSYCGKEIGGGNFCSSCGQKSSSNSQISEKRSNFWYLLPIFLSLIGGIIAYFILRNSDPKKAKNCIFIGIGVLILGMILNWMSFEWYMTYQDITGDVGEDIGYSLGYGLAEIYFNIIDFFS
jgi:hypothetical protein